ncbi:8-oxo-dGTP pyrophosphatase MutT, NUDIX family [Cognatiyoonia koreensis]|uniref:8-oxo-dGTP pyrophosphatase MutT, NUDIX family n=1 Tax=Cognatiyoonia koreensis TaxID=364200 RepID=A0A1I0QFT3_9RHOB|nr:NUDIX hydrolase [Cognatiyoonia koreensis]SEW25475.1 8-oxo-dGTP pyrophosphatase MutT, NUDIX family [Cognatiyoonia koreensis]
MDKTAIRDAATLILLRDLPDGPAVLMGQRGKSAAFMPGKFVFPGGAIDPNDAQVPVQAIAPDVQVSLTQDSKHTPTAILAAAIRELWEETGLILGTPGTWHDAHQGWRGFAGTGHLPSAQGCAFFFRAVTPAGRPRRFDARFVLAAADHLASDPDDFSRAEDELSHLQWVHLAKARDFDLPFITQVVLAELTAHVNGTRTDAGVPFFRNDDEDRLVTRLGGAAVL